MTPAGEELHARAFGADDDAPRTLGLAAVSDRCVACATPMSSDQRYCVNCGERRSKPRFSLAQSSAEPVAAPPANRPPRTPRATSGATLIAGVGTLLLAMGVGVLIGLHGSSGSTAPSTRVITVNSGPSSATVATATTGAAAAPTGASRSSTRRSSAKHAKATKAVPASNSGAAKVLGGSAKNLPPATVTVGASGSGAGYQGGKFTGNFFGQ
jgi:hypothetical protein